jgi:hypothetical protein
MTGNFKALSTLNVLSECPKFVFDLFFRHLSEESERGARFAQQIWVAFTDFLITNINNDNPDNVGYHLRINNGIGRREKEELMVF